MRIYHYLPAEFALKDLKERRLKISRLNELNDPFELVAVRQTEKASRKIWDSWRQDLIDRWGLVCFSKTWRNPVLWSHYGDKHKGFCLGFDVPDEKIIQINYTKNRLDLDILRLYENGKLDESHMLRLFKTKFYDWRYEREVRVYSRLDLVDVDTGFYFCDFSDEMQLRDVFVGPLCTETEDTIRSHIQPEDAMVKIVRTRLAFKTFDVVEQKLGFIHEK